MVTVDEIRAAFSYNPETGVISRGGKPAGWDNGNGYIRLSFKNQKLYAHRVAWAFVYGAWVDEIDHKNGVRSDNRLENLRVATHSRNIANAGSRRAGMPKGAYRCSDSSGRWFSSIRVNGRNVHLGRFDTKEDAHAAYVLAAGETFGEFARG